MASSRAFGGRKMRRSLIIIAGALLMIASASAASAQDYKQLREWCYGDSTDDQTIQGRNAVVLSNQETQKNKGDAIGNRGLAYKHKGQLDRALEDYDEAIRLNPNYSTAYSNRGIAYKKKGMLDQAKA